jgi:hypothetical protein
MQRCCSGRLIERAFEIDLCEAQRFVKRTRTFQVRNEEGCADKRGNGHRSNVPERGARINAQRFWLAQDYVTMISGMRQFLADCL